MMMDGNVRMYYLETGVKTYQNNTLGTINYTTGQITLTSLNIPLFQILEEVLQQL